MLPHITRWAYFEVKWPLQYCQSEKGGGPIFEGKLTSKDYCMCEPNLLVLYDPVIILWFAGGNGFSTYTSSHPVLRCGLPSFTPS